MTDAVTNILITAKDQTGQAFASVNSGLLGLSAQAIKATSALGAIGAGAAFASMTAFAKQTIDAQDELFKLSQKTGIAVESLAGLEFAAEQSGVELEKVATATRKFGLLVAESADASSGAAKKLAQLGLTYKDLKDLSPEKQLLALSDALSKFSKEDRAVALTSLLGNKMADLIPLLSGGSKSLSELIEQGKKFNPVTEESAKKAEQFNDQLNVLNKSVSTLGREMVQGIIPSLSRVTDEMVKATQQSGLLSGAMAGIKQLFIESFGNPKILGDVGQIRREILKTEEAIAKMPKGDSIFFNSNALESEKNKLARLKTELQAAIEKSRESIAVQDQATESGKKFVAVLDEGERKLTGKNKAQDELNKAQSNALRIEGEYIKLLQHERKVREDLIKPFQQEAKAAQDKLRSMQQEQKAIELSERRQISLAQAIEETTIARLEEKRAATKDGTILAEINKEIAARRQMIGVIRETEARTNSMAKTTRNATDEANQLWIQAGRNIQSALSTSIFNFFDDGLKGMVKNVASAVGRIAAEFAALKIADSLGLTRMFGVSGVPGAGFSGSGANAATNALSLASISSGAGNLFKTGLGSTSVLGSLGSSLPGRAGAFFSGMGGGAIPGVSSQAALMGQSFASVAGPAIALFAAHGISKAFAGDKTFGNGFTDALQKVPVIGILPNVLAGLFGHGPMKFRQQSLQGNISADGFDGDITNVFRAKGGLAVKNKHKSVTEQLSQEMQDTFDLTIKGFANSTKEAAQVLGLSSSFIDTYNKEIQIKSEKGKTLTEEAIQNIFKDLGNEFAQGVLPNIAEFRKLGEDASTTLSRLTTEFGALEAGARNLGASAELAKSLVNEMSIGARTQLVEMLGGAEATIQKTSFFFNNFISGSERLATASAELDKQLSALGVSANISKEDFAELIQTAGTSNELRTALLDLQEAYLLVKNATEENINVLIAAAQNLGATSQLAGQLVSGMSTDAQAAFIEMAGGASQFLAGTQIFNERFLTDTDRLQIASANVAKVLNDLGLSADLTAPQLKELVQSLGTPQNIRAGLLDPNFLKDFFLIHPESTKAAEGTNRFAEAIKRYQDKINRLIQSTDNSIALIGQGLQKFLDLSKSVKDAIGGIIPQSVDDARKSVLGQISVNPSGQLQGVKDINSFDTQALSTLANQSSSGFTNRLDFERSRARNLEILTLFSAAVNKSISNARDDLRYSNTERNNLMRKLPSFDVGGIVPRTELAIVHKGERIINPQQNEAIVQLLQQLIISVKTGSNYSQSLYDLFRRMTNDGLSLKTVAA